MQRAAGVLISPHISIFCLTTCQLCQLTCCKYKSAHQGIGTQVAAQHHAPEAGRAARQARGLGRSTQERQSRQCRSSSQQCSSSRQFGSGRWRLRRRCGATGSLATAHDDQPTQSPHVLRDAGAAGRPAAERAAQPAQPAIDAASVQPSMSASGQCRAVSHQLVLAQDWCACTVCCGQNLVRRTCG